MKLINSPLGEGLVVHGVWSPLKPYALFCDMGGISVLRRMNLIASKGHDAIANMYTCMDMKLFSLESPPSPMSHDSNGESIVLNLGGIIYVL